MASRQPLLIVVGAAGERQERLAEGLERRLSVPVIERLDLGGALVEVDATGEVDVDEPVERIREAAPSGA